MHEPISEKNFLMYVARHYDNPQCQSTEEFFEDVKRIKYVKKLITRYAEGGDLKERLILNHLIILNNVFGPEHLCRILYVKMAEQMKYVKPFLVLLNVMPRKMYNVCDSLMIDTDLIPMEQRIVDVLRREVLHA
jgi:hypothetical protein